MFYRVDVHDVAIVSGHFSQPAVLVSLFKQTWKISTVSNTSNMADCDAPPPPATVCRAGQSAIMCNVLLHFHV